MALTKARRGKRFNGPPARNQELAKRNRSIVREVRRKTNPLSETAAAAKYGISQPTVSLIVRNVNSTQVAA